MATGSIAPFLSFMQPARDVLKSQPRSVRTLQNELNNLIQERDQFINQDNQTIAKQGVTDVPSSQVPVPRRRQGATFYRNYGTTGEILRPDTVIGSVPKGIAPLGQYGP